MCRASGAERIEQAERDLKKDALSSEGNMIATLLAPHSAHMLCTQHAIFAYPILNSSSLFL